MSQSPIPVESEIKWLPIKDLKPNPKNPNKHPEEQIERLVKIIRYQGWRSPIIVSNQSGYIVAGHGRLEAAKKLGFTVVPVQYQDFESDDQEYAHMTADNAIASWAELDLAAINLDIPDIGPDFDIDLLGIKDFTIDAADKYADKDADEVPEVKETDIKLGDLFILGNHRLLCGDATKKEDVDRLMDGQKAEFCFTSPPYSDQRDYSGNLQLDPKHLANFLSAPSKCFAVNLGLKRERGSIVSYWDDYIASAKSFNLPLSSWNVWNRQGFGFSIGNATADFPIEHEFIFIFGKPVKMNPIVANKSAGRFDNYGTVRQKNGSTKQRSGTTVKTHRSLGTVLHLGQEAERTIDHPAKFPVALPETYILGCSNPNSIIYEPFLGSGSTLIACHKTGRRCFSMEIDPHYCSVSIKRWEKFTGQKATKA